MVVSACLNLDCTMVSKGFGQKRMSLEDSRKPVYLFFKMHYKRQSISRRVYMFTLESCIYFNVV